MKTKNKKDVILIKTKKNFFVRKFFQTFFLFSFLFIFSGCGFSGKPDGGVHKSFDGGKTFQPKNFVGEKANIGGVNVLALEIDPLNAETIYIGTEKEGIYRSTDGGEKWVKDINNFQNVTEIVIHPNLSNIIYITAKKAGRGKVLKTTDGGENWQEIYTMNVDGPAIVSLAMNKRTPETLYIGTSEGGIFKTTDGGATWKTLLWEKSSIRKIVIDNANPNIVYFGTVSSGAFLTKDGGTNFSEMKKSGYIYNIISYPNAEGNLLLSDKDGLQKSNDFGENWQVINTLVKPEKLGTRGLDINPNNSNEIFYASAKAMYKSTNGGETWSAIQFNISRSIELIRINPKDTNIIYLGMYNRGGTSGIKLLP